jgi:hypothetical protein
MHYRIDTISFKMRAVSILNSDEVRRLLMKLSAKSGRL